MVRLVSGGDLDDTFKLKPSWSGLIDFDGMLSAAQRHRRLTRARDAAAPAVNPVLPPPRDHEMTLGFHLEDA